MKLTRHTSILLAFLILASNIGLALNVHYCAGRVSSVSFAYRVDAACAHPEKKKAKTCCGKPAKDHKGCCKSDIVKLQDNGDNIIVKSFQLDLASFCAINEWKPAQFYTAVPVVAGQPANFYCEAHAPPLFKLYCQYILYA